MPTGIYVRTEKNKHTKETRLKMMGRIPWNKGKKWDRKMRKKLSIAHLGLKYIRSEEFCLKLSDRFSNEKHPLWKGDDVGYSGVHSWIRRHKGSPENCEHCGKIGKKTGRRWNIEWANVDHKYRRVFEDYIALCCNCHKNFDDKK